MLDRRAALARLAALTGASLVGAEFFLAGCRRPDKRAPAPFDADGIALLDEIGETILPATDTPGARAAGVGAVIARIVSDCYDDEAQLAFQDGVADVETRCRAMHGRAFRQCASPERLRLLTTLNDEMKAESRPKADPSRVHPFRAIKDLVLLAYFTSEVGCTQALRYVETPGRFDGDVPHAALDRAWVNPMRHT